MEEKDHAWFIRRSVSGWLIDCNLEYYCGTGHEYLVERAALAWGRYLLARQEDIADKWLTFTNPFGFKLRP
jgi:hypothetical protein